MSVDASRSKSVEHAHTGRIRDVALGGEAWSWCTVRKTAVIVSRACFACAWVLKQLPKCHASWSKSVSFHGKRAIVPFPSMRK